jgi:hypothetical protein
MASNPQPAVQPLQMGRPLGSWQKSEAFVVAMIPCRTIGLGNPRRSEGTPLVPQRGSATKDVVTAPWAISAIKPFASCQSMLAQRPCHCARNSESRMRENRLSGLMRGGKPLVIGLRASQSTASRLLYMHALAPVRIVGEARGRLERHSVRPIRGFDDPHFDQQLPGGNRPKKWKCFAPHRSA